MTWPKYGTEFWPQLRHAGFSDAAARTHAEAIAYLYEAVQLPDGDLLPEDVVPLLSFPMHLTRVFCGSRDYEDGVAECLSREAWAQEGDRFRLVHHAEVVAESLISQRKKKASNAKAQRVARSKRRSAAARVIDDAVDDPGDDAIDTGEQAGKQTDSREVQEATVVPLPRASGETWPPVAPPGSLSSRATMRRERSEDR